MSYIEEISWMSGSGYSDLELLEYIDKHFDEIECEFNGEEYKEPKKHDCYFCMDCKLRKIVDYENRKNDLILIMTPEKQDKTLELSKHWSVDSTPARNEVIMKRTYPVKSVKCDKICSNY